VLSPEESAGKTGLLDSTAARRRWQPVALDWLPERSGKYVAYGTFAERFGDEHTARHRTVRKDCDAISGTSEHLAWQPYNSGFSTHACQKKGDVAGRQEIITGNVFYHAGTDRRRMLDLWRGRDRRLANVRYRRRPRTDRGLPGLDQGELFLKTRNRCGAFPISTGKKFLTAGTHATHLRHNQ